MILYGCTLQCVLKAMKHSFFRAHMQLMFVQIKPDNDKTVIYYNILTRLFFPSSPKMHLLLSCPSPRSKSFFFSLVYKNGSPPLQMQIRVFQLTRDPESKSKPAGAFTRVSYFSLLKRTQDER